MPNKYKSSIFTQKKALDIIFEEDGNNNTELDSISLKLNH
jgi:hypothetical protein